VRGAGSLHLCPLAMEMKMRIRQRRRGSPGDRETKLAHAPTIELAGTA